LKSAIRCCLRRQPVWVFRDQYCNIL